LTSASRENLGDFVPVGLHGRGNPVYDVLNPSETDVEFQHGGAKRLDCVSAVGVGSSELAYKSGKPGPIAGVMAFWDGAFRGFAAIGAFPFHQDEMPNNDFNGGP